MARTSNGHFVWHGLLTKDPNAAVAFYSEVVGWKAQPFAEGDYVMWVGSEGPLGGVMRLPDEAAKRGIAPSWIGNVQVADVEATAALTKKLGGNVYRVPADIPTIGRSAVIADPQGVAVAIFEPTGAMTTRDRTKEREFCWSELTTSDSAAAFAFYSELFGWKALEEIDMGPMGTYRVCGIGEEPIGGMMKRPKDDPMPPCWIHYTEMRDLDAAVSRALRMRAKLTSGPFDLPGGGRIAQLTDPQGAEFALHQAPKA